MIICPVSTHACPYPALCRDRCVRDLGALLIEAAAAERRAQDQQWGVQNHPWIGDSPYLLLAQWGANLQVQGQLAEQTAKAMVQRKASVGTVTYLDILMEEVVEAVCAESAGDTITELVQVAAVALAAAESVMRNGR